MALAMHGPSAERERDYAHCTHFRCLLELIDDFITPAVGHQASGAPAGRDRRGDARRPVDLRTTGGREQPAGQNAESRGVRAGRPSLSGAPQIARGHREHAGHSQGGLHLYPYRSVEPGAASREDRPVRGAAGDPGGAAYGLAARRPPFGRAAGEVGVGRVDGHGAAPRGAVQSGVLPRGRTAGLDQSGQLSQQPGRPRSYPVHVGFNRHAERGRHLAR